VYESGSLLFQDDFPTRQAAGNGHSGLDSSRLSGWCVPVNVKKQTRSLVWTGLTFSDTRMEVDTNHLNLAADDDFGLLPGSG
jgi:hypothetical protein